MPLQPVTAKLMKALFLPWAGNTILTQTNSKMFLRAGDDSYFSILLVSQTFLNSGKTFFFLILKLLEKNLERSFETCKSDKACIAMMIESEGENNYLSNILYHQ